MLTGDSITPSCARSPAAIAICDQHAMWIRPRERLDEVLADGDELWVVPAAVHV